MTRDPFAAAAEQPLFIVPRVLDGLRGLRERMRAEQEPRDARVRAELDRLAEQLLEDVERHPTRSWVLKQCRRSLRSLEAQAVPAARAALEPGLRRLLDVLGIDGHDGMLAYYLDNES